jgi:hypothetical protein
MSKKVFLVMIASSLALAGIACGGSRSQTPESEEPTPPPPTATSVPIPPPPQDAPAELPNDSDLRELIQYANLMQPILTQAGTILERDGQILKEAEGGNDTVLCDGRLEADNLAMKNLVYQVQAIEAPSDARAIHDLVIQSGTAWTEALDEVETFCETGNPLYKVTAAVKLWEAGVALQDAGNRFWLLLMSEGVEDWVQR